MAVIAVAGATGGVGRAIVETLLERSTHTIILLSRGSPDPDPAFSKTHQLQVDYSSIESVAQLLQQHGVHTVISTIGLVSDEACQAQLNLIRAAEQSSATKRFVPSEFSFIFTEDLLPVDPTVQPWLDAVNLLRTTSLEYTRVVPGFFMDYWGMPQIQTHLYPESFGVSMYTCEAAIPGDGNDMLSMTYTYDMAAFLVKILDLPQWPEISIVVGDEITYNQILELGEQVRGQKFRVTYDSHEDIKKGNVTVPPPPPGNEVSTEERHEMTVSVSRLTIAGAAKLPDENRLKARFPEIKPIKMKDFLLKAWKN